MIAAYCIRVAGQPGPDPGLRGRGGGKVRLLEEAGVGAWISGAVAADATLEEIRAHDRVVRAAMRTATPLPVRFGAAFRDEEEVRGMLRERSVELREALRRVEGCVELGVRVVWTGAPPAPGGAPEPVRSGREYLEARRRALRAEEARRAEAEALLDRVEACFAEMRLPAVRALLPEEGVAGTVAHLVHRSELSRYRACAERARGELGSGAVRFTGPWAPYSFV